METHVLILSKEELCFPSYELTSHQNETMPGLVLGFWKQCCLIRVPMSILIVHSEFHTFGGFYFDFFNKHYVAITTCQARFLF